MATRLEITHGLIAERDRLSTSADTLSVTRPTTGSKTRSKGVLFIIVGSSVPGPRAREATALVAETIRHEYYYDESAGVPVCLEKAVKSADRQLRRRAWERYRIERRRGHDGQIRGPYRP